MPVDFNPMLFNYPIRENLARFFGFKVGLGGCPWSFEEVAHHVESFIQQGVKDKKGL
jgi:hypothetical protein